MKLHSASLKWFNRPVDATLQPSMFGIESRKSTDFAQLQFWVSGHRQESSAGRFCVLFSPVSRGLAGLLSLLCVSCSLFCWQPCQTAALGAPAERPASSQAMLGTWLAHNQRLFRYSVDSHLTLSSYYLEHTELFTDKRLSLCHLPSLKHSDIRYFQPIKLPSPLCSLLIIVSSSFFFFLTYYALIYSMYLEIPMFTSGLAHVSSFISS